MTDQADELGVTPEPGFKLEPRSFWLDRADEERMLKVTGGDVELFGGNIDPAALIPLAIREASRNGISANGMVNMMQRIVVDAPLALNAEIRVTGQVTQVHHTPRGIVWICETNFSPAVGGPGIRTSRTALMTNPLQKADPDARGTIPRPAPAVTDPSRLTKVASVAMTPEDCVTYCGATTNLIHTDLAFAQNAGYRAPIVGGSHGVRYMTAAIWRSFSPKSLDMEIMFRRPIFWDDTFDVCADMKGDTWTALCTARHGKVLSEMRLNAIA